MSGAELQRPADRLIGQAACPVCEHPGARVSLMKTQRVSLVCNHCKCQVFARGDLSDQLMRDTIKPRQAAEPAPAPAPVPAAPAPAPAQAQKPSWGVLGW